MSDFRNVSKSEPCPICGKPDWCSVQTVEDGVRLHYCRRLLNGTDTTSPTDGRRYIFIKQARDGSCIYKDEADQEKSRQRWRNAHGMPQESAARKRQVQDQSPSREPDDGVTPLPSARLDAIYRAFLHKLSLKKNHVRYLQRERWPRELILASMVRSMPPAGRQEFPGMSREAIAEELARKFGSLEGVPGFYRKGNTWTFAGPSGLLLPLYDHNRMLYRLRLRLDHPEIGADGKEKNKYHNFSSYCQTNKGGQAGNIYPSGCRSGSHIGLYADPKRDDFSVCYITEGEKKSIYANHVLRCPVISIPGVSAFGKVLETADDGRNVLNFLHAMGCTTVIIAYDSDKYINEAVLMYERKLIGLLLEQNTPFRVALAYWNPGFGKGLDDILAVNVRPNYELVKA